MENELTYKVIGCAMGVHKLLGHEQEIFYKTHHVGTRRADFIIQNKLVIELKAVIELEDVHLSQAKNYLVAYNKKFLQSLNPGHPDTDN